LTKRKKRILKSKNNIHLCRPLATFDLHPPLENIQIFLVSHMPSLITDKILNRLGHDDLLHVLSEKLSGSELNSLLLDVFNHRSAGCSPPELLKHYQLNRFVKPADVPVLDLKLAELELLRIFAEYGFNPIEVSPVAVLGSCSVVAPADQKKILSALRGTEVLADATNSLALHISDLKKRREWNPERNEKLRFGAIQRHVRTQSISGKGFTPHFKIGCVVTSGMDTGSFSFEKEALTEHVSLMKKIFEDYYKVDQVSFRLVCRDGYPDSLKLATEVGKFISGAVDGIKFDIIEAPEKEIQYYKGIQYKVDIRIKNRTFEIADGGFVDWTQQLLQNKKERFLITGFGFELMYRIMNGMV
jgi:hypothetical protein